MLRTQAKTLLDVLQLLRLVPISRLPLIQTTAAKARVAQLTNSIPTERPAPRTLSGETRAQRIMSAHSARVTLQASMLDALHSIHAHVADLQQHEELRNTRSAHVDKLTLGAENHYCPEIDYEGLNHLATHGIDEAFMAARGLHVLAEMRAQRGESDRHSMLNSAHATELPTEESEGH